MPESIYYQYRRELGQALQERLLAPGILVGDSGWASDVFIESQEETLPEAPDTAEESDAQLPSTVLSPNDPGIFFEDARMTDIRKEAIATVAGIVVVHQSISVVDIRGLADLGEPTFRYALGFLRASMFARFRTVEPHPRHKLIVSGQERSFKNHAYYPSDLLMNMAEVADEKYPLLDRAMQKYGEEKA